MSDLVSFTSHAPKIRYPKPKRPLKTGLRTLYIMNYLLELIFEREMISVRVPAKYNLGTTVPLFDRRPDAFVRKEKYETECADKTKPAKVPRDKSSVERVVFDR